GRRGGTRHHRLDELVDVRRKDAALGTAPADASEVHSQLTRELAHSGSGMRLLERLFVDHRWSRRGFVPRRRDGRGGPSVLLSRRWLLLEGLLPLGAVSGRSLPSVRLRRGLAKGLLRLGMLDRYPACARGGHGLLGRCRFLWSGRGT